MIDIKNLKVNVEEKEILKGVNISFDTGKNYLLLGKNGSGKSSLSQFLMGNPVYKYVSGDVSIDKTDLMSLKVNQRSDMGLFLSFQNIPELVGVNIGEYLRIIYNNALHKNSPETKPLSPFVFKRFLKKYLDELSIDEKFLTRDLNVGFSGGEKRKIEILQARLLQPKYIILDEIDSGLDVDAFKIVANLISKINNENNALIVITHQFQITQYISFDTIYILKDGKVERTGGQELIQEIKEKGFQ